MVVATVWIHDGCLSTANIEIVVVRLQSQATRARRALSTQIAHPLFPRRHLPFIVPTAHRISPVDGSLMPVYRISQIRIKCPINSPPLFPCYFLESLLAEFARCSEQLGGRRVCAEEGSFESVLLSRFPAICFSLLQDLACFLEGLFGAFDLLSWTSLL